MIERSGVLFAYLGSGTPPGFPRFDCFIAPNSHTFAFKGKFDCNWLQSLEVGIFRNNPDRPAHSALIIAEMRVVP